PNSAGTTVTFTVDSPSDYVLDVRSLDFSNDFGGAGVSFSDADGTTIFELFNFFTGDPTMSEGVLAPGTYTLNYFGSSQGSVSVDLLVVPAPGAVGVLWAAGVLASRRRR
ncbi:MAG: hypothetical protein AAFY46_09450, partial [Planctomycetota bacterium]